jgi:hypothetical protein
MIKGGPRAKESSRGRRLSPVTSLTVRILASAIVLCGASVSVAGCTSDGISAKPTPTASRGVPFGSDYSSARCPSAKVASKALGTAVTLMSAKLKGYEFDCNYAGQGGVSVLVGYNYNDSLSAGTFLHDLEKFTELANIHRVPNVGTVAYEQANPSGAISVLAIAHNYTIALLANGASTQGDDKLERIAVNAWSH